MKVEILIYIYLIVCISMILFNIACIFAFRHKDRRLFRYSTAFASRVKWQSMLGGADQAHIRYLLRKLKHIDNLLAFDKTLEELFHETPVETRRYLNTLSPVFIQLTLYYLKKDKLQAAYFPCLIKKYQIFHGKQIRQIDESLLSLVQDSSLYCRENALQALYSIGNARIVIEALHLLDKSGYYHHAKLITDGLLTFRGDKKELADMLWADLFHFSERMQVTILDYFRFSSGDYCEPMLKLLLSQERSDEAAYSCIRYFGKYHYDPVLPYLLEFARKGAEDHWEYAAIAATSLSSYPTDETIELLKTLLHNSNWYIRYNASQSLDRLGLDYTDLIDIFEGKDRYAREIMQYRLDQQKMKKKEAQMAE